MDQQNEYTKKRKKIDEFARLFVVPQGGHGLSGKSYTINGEGKPVEVRNIASPNGNDNIDLLVAWVEKKQSPAKTLVVDEKGRIGTDTNVKGYLLCSYPNYPRYVSGAVDHVSSYVTYDLLCGVTDYHVFHSMFSFHFIPLSTS